MSNRKSINIIGNILMILSFAFIVNRIIEYRIDFSIIFSVWTFIILTISIIICALLVMYLANIFYALLKLFSNNEISKKDTMFIYCKSNLYKYLPGNIFHYVGRNQIAIHEKTSHGTVIATTIAEILLLALSAVIITITFAGQYAFKWSLDNYTNKEIIMILLLIVIIVIASIILYIVNPRIKEWVAKSTIQINHIKFSVTLKFIIAYIIIFILNGAMFAIIFLSIGAEINIHLILPIIGMYTLSWIIGFVTPGAPAGLGIREVIISTLLIGIVEAELVITAVLLFRIVTIMGDVVAFIMANQFRR